MYFCFYMTVPTLVGTFKKYFVSIHVEKFLREISQIRSNIFRGCNNSKNEGITTFRICYEPHIYVSLVKL